MTRIPDVVHVGLIQMACGDDPQANLHATIERIRAAATQGAQIICTQELFQSRYFCKSEAHANFALAEPIPGTTTELMQGLAEELGVVIIASLFEKRTEGIYHNTAVVLDADGRLVGKYRKMHIPDDPLYYEKFYFTPGDLGFRAFDTRYGRIGVLICWDQWYPEAARLTALRGAEIIFYPTAIGWYPRDSDEVQAAQHDSWELIQRSHAVANGCYVASINRTGYEPQPDNDPQGGINFWGQSFVADPQGQLLARAASDADELLVVAVDRRRIDNQRVYWPFLRDRRIDAYGELDRRFIDQE